MHTPIHTNHWWPLVILLLLATTGYSTGLTFQVDTRNISVNGGMYIAGEFGGAVGSTNWTPIAMCDQGDGIWSITFDAPAGFYQYKFQNGIGGWEFDPGTGPCTNPLDNNNRTVNYPGGSHLEGPFCFDSCDPICSGFGPASPADSDPPNITEPAPSAVTLACGDPLPAPSTLSAEDACDFNVTTMTAMPTDDMSGIGACGTGDIIRTWTATDCAGNETSVTQTITIADSAPPTITEAVPPPISFPCGTLPTANPLAANDDCDTGVTTTGLPTDDLTGIGACGTGTIVRTWEVSDCAGNMTSASQTITITDGAPPSITGAVPADVTLECQNIPTASPLSASDNCDSDVSSTGPPTDDMSAIGACGTGTVVRTWEVSDCTGNMVSVSQNITITDNTPPTFPGGFPADVTVTCGNLPAANALAASDACDMSVTTSGPPVDDMSGIGPCGTGTVTRTWEVSDCAGNMASVSQTITIADSTPPTITDPIPTDISIVCGDPLPLLSPLAATDDCDSGVTSTGPPTEDASGISPCGVGILVREWTVSDCSGNTTTISQNITITDNTPPVFLVPIPADETVQCSGIPPAAELDAQDACDPGVLFSDFPVDDMSGLNACGFGTLLRTWTVTDCSGNTATGTQTITILDDEAPEIMGIPADVTVPCGSLPPGAPLDAFDTCDQSILFTDAPVDDLSGLGGCGAGTVIRTWVVTDCAGNPATATQIITIADEDAPTIDEPIPDDETVNCGNLPTANALTASDACDASVSTTGMPTDDLSGLSACGIGTLVRTWSVSDCSGNVFSASQNITIVDNTAPSLSIPPDMNVDCGAVPPEDPTAAVASDNCDPSPAVIYEGETTVGTGCPFELHRTWRAEDACGNTISFTQIITVSDTEAPVFQNPPGNLAVCTGDVPPLTDLTWTDECDGTGTVAGTEVSDGMTNPETITRAWTYTDGCGNMADHVQTIIISDSGMASVGPDLTVCGDAPVSLSAAGGGGGTPTWTSSGDGIFSNENAAMTDYSPGMGDLAAGSVTLTFTPGSGGSCAIAPDELVLTFATSPSANAGTDQTLTCTITSVILDGSGSDMGTYEWSGPGITPANLNELSPTVGEPGQYILTVSASGQNCSSMDTVVVMENLDGPVADAGPDQTLTCTITSVILDGSGSDAGDHEWSGPGITPANMNELSPTVDEPGQYILTVSASGQNCSSTATVTVFEDGDLPTANAGMDMAITCAASSVTLDGSGTIPSTPVYLWSGPGINAGNEAMPNPMVSQSGIYVLIVTDQNNGCTDTDEVEVTLDGDVPTADPGDDQTITCAVPTATLDGAGSSSGAGISLEWFDPDNVSLGAGPAIMVSEGGTYSLTVSNANNGCDITSQLTVMVDTLSPTATGGNPTMLTCEILQTELGDATVADPDWTWQWTGAGIDATNVNSPTPTVDVADTYTVFVSNQSNGCTAVDMVVVFQDTISPAANAGTDQTIDCVASSVVLDGTGSSTANGPVEYLWSGPGISPTNENEADPTVSQSGIYTLTVSDPVNGCTDDGTVAVMSDGDLPTATAGLGGELNCMVSNLTLDGAGSTSGMGIEYEWTDAVGTVLGTALTLVVNDTGTYTLEVMNTLNNCSQSASAIVTIDTLSPAANAGADQAFTCTQTSATLNGGGMGQGALSYLWAGPGITSANGMEQNPSVTDAGIYTLTVTDSDNGCTASDEMEITQDASLPSADAGPDQMLTCAVDMATLSGSGTGGGNLSFLWAGPGIDATNETLPSPTVGEPGIYTLTVTDDATGCTSPAATVEVLENTTPPSALIAPPSDIDCQFSSSLLDATGSTGSGSISYSWSGPDIDVGNENLPNPTVAQAGIYEVTITDAGNGCTATASAEVMASGDLPEVEIVQTEILSCANPIIELVETLSSGLPNMQFEWNNLGSGNIVQANGTTAQVDQVGIYVVEVTDLSSGCAEADTIEIEVNFDIVQINLDNVSEGGCTSSTLSTNIIYEDTSGDSISIIWTGPNGYNSIEVQPSVSEPGDYQIIAVNNGSGCSDTAQTTFVLAAGIENVLATATSPLCIGDGNGILSIDSVAGLNPPYLFSLDGGPFTAAQSFENLAPGNYTLTVQDAEGCDWQDDFIIEDGQLVLLELGDDLEIELGETVRLSPQVSPTEVRYGWTNTETLSCDDCPNPEAQPTETTTYQLTVVDSNGCEAVDDLTILVDARPKVYAPNAFSPNGDGLNDGFTLYAGAQVAQIDRLLIFDRWGANVFEIYNLPPNVPDLGWDGTHNDEAAQGGVYVFFAEIRLLDGRTELIEGEVVLMR